jgi:DNA-binding GntR family transcriptional regulator
MSTDRQSSSARAYADIKRLIVDGSVQPGDRMNVRLLGERLRLSATPVKAALSALARDGYVTSKPNAGYFVTVLRDRDVRDLFQLREALEPYAVRLAATGGADGARLDELRDLTTAQRTAAARGEHATYNDLNLRFHRTLWRLADNARLNQVMDDVVGLISLVTTFTARAPGRIDHAIDEHIMLVDLCANGDGERAYELTARHVRDSHAAYRQMVTWEP